jgi:ferredoxin
MKKTAKKKIGNKKAAVKKTAAKKTVRKKAAAKKPVSLPAGKARAAAPAGVPNIDYSLCQGCSGCAEAYPHLFEMRGERAWLTDADAYDPVRDASIMTICPYYAITIEKV